MARAALQDKSQLTRIGGLRQFVMQNHSTAPWGDICWSTSQSRLTFRKSNGKPRNRTWRSLARLRHLSGLYRFFLLAARSAADW